MSTERQRLQAQINGSKSHGPQSTSGRAISSRNATTHGLYAQSACLASEDRELYLQHHDLFLERYQPADPFEQYLVTRMADIEWKLLRAGHIESALVDTEIDAQIPQLTERFEEIDPQGLWAAALKSLAATPVLNALDRGQTRLSRQYARLRHELHQLQSQSNRTEKLQNEPDSEQPSLESTN